MTSVYRRGKMRLCSASKIKFGICVLTPLALLPLALSPHKELKCAYVILWMAVYWILGSVHITVTALMPVFLYPLLGILDSSEVAPNYMKEVLMMFVGGLGVAVAVEHCNLHERVALKVLLTLGSDTKKLILGFMLTTMFLSMWISSTATTAMMVPIIEAVMAELRKNDGSDESQTHLLHKALLLGACYAANCGGTGTITGTSPNMIFKGYIDEFHPGSSEITYASWMAYNIPGMLLCVLAGWLVLQVAYVPCWHKQDEESKCRIRKVISTRYKELGKITFHEAAVLTLFVVMVLLWVFREPKFMIGWGDLLASQKKVGDSAPAIAILFLMFLLPAEPWKRSRSAPLLPWSVMQKKLPWGLVLLLGGGYALAHGAQKSGLSKLLGDQMSEFSYPPAVVLLIVCILTAVLTEIVSNSTVVTMLLPVIDQMTIAFRLNPLYLMLPLVIIASSAFMLPVAAGPNAIIFATGHLETLDMVKPGIFMNIIAVIVQLFMIHTLGDHLLYLHTFPSWANKTAFPEIENVTEVLNTVIYQNRNMTEIT